MKQMMIIVIRLNIIKKGKSDKNIRIYFHFDLMKISGRKSYIRFLFEKKKSNYIIYVQYLIRNENSRNEYIHHIIILCNTKRNTYSITRIFLLYFCVRF